MNGEFDTSNLAWIVYKLFYGKNFIVNKSTEREYVTIKFGNKDINFSGDTDFNFGPGWSHTISNKYKNYLKNVPDSYRALYSNQLVKCQKLYKKIPNISLMPQTGNLQATKKNVGNDRFDTFIWALNSYYSGQNSLLFNYSTFQNADDLKTYFDCFRSINQNQDPIYNYCSSIYKIEAKLVDELIESGKNALDTPERIIEYMQLAFRFWCQKIMQIKTSYEDNKKMLTPTEIAIIDSEIKESNAILEEWFDEK